MDIVAKNVSYTYSEGTPFEKRALNNVNFRIPSASFTGIIGHTGSGKSTLIQHFNGLLRPMSGLLKVGDVTVSASLKNVSELRRQVGMVFQYPEHQLFEETVAKDVAFGPRQFALAEREVEERVRDALSLVGLEYDQVAEMSPFQLSGGQMRRVAIAGVLAMRPKVLVLDEPTAGLDPQGKEDILQTIVDLKRTESLTVICVSHSMEDVARYADHLLVMHQGTVVMEGDPIAVFRKRDQLQSYGLDLPPVLDWVHRLNAFVEPQIPYALYTPEQLAEEIAIRWRKRTEPV